MFQRKFGGRLTKNFFQKRAKASEAYDGQECAEIRHTAARSLDTERWTRILFFGSVQYRIATICGIAASETYIYSYTSICIVPNMMLTQIPRRKQVLPRVQVLSRLGTDTTSTPAAAAAAAVPGLESTKGLAPEVTSGSTEPK